MHSEHTPHGQSGGFRRLLRIAAVTATLAVGAAALPATALAAPPGIPPEVAGHLLDKVERQGTVKVIVGLSLPGRPFRLESNLPDQAAVGQQRAAIAMAQQALVQEIENYGVQTRRAYVTLPYISLQVDANALRHLLNSPRVTSIEEVQVYGPTLQSTGEWIGSFNTWSANFGGQGQSVAIIDTGIDNDHPFFGGGGQNSDVNRVVDEACFSTNDANSLCPDGTDAQYGPGAADVVGVANCYAGGAVGSGSPLCDHGTHVAGIAAGQDDGTRGYDGVAPKAGIVAIQAAHRVDDCDDDADGNQPCVQFFSDDTIAGLDWVRLYSDTHNNVAAVNMSLGGGFHYQPCDGAAERTAVQQLQAAGIATAIAAGNDGWTWASGSPGCVPEAVTVGGVFDGPSTAGDLPDDVLFNMAEWVDLMAVGIWVDSSVPDDGWAQKGGTSMATPQVTGAFAVVRSINPGMGVDEIEQLLEDTGVLVQDQRVATPVSGDDDYPEPCDAPDCQPRTGLVKPRLALDWAVAGITTADLGIYKDCKPDGIKSIGEWALCHLTVENLGPDAAMDVQVVDSFISDGSYDFEFGTVSNPLCTSTPNPQNPGGKVTCNLGAILSGEVVEITIPVKADQPLNVDNNASVSALTPDPDTGNNHSTDNLEFGPAQADLSITKSDSPDPVTAGENLSYTLQVANAGPSPAEAVVVTDNLPAGVALVSVTPSTGNCTTSPLVCNLGNLAMGDTETVSLTVQVLPETRGQLDNSAEVSSDTLDPDNGNNLAQESTTVNAEADLAVAKTLTSAEVVAGAEIAYQVIVSNLGPSTATDVVLTDTMPAYTTFVSAKDAGNASVCTADQATPVVTLTCGLGTIGPGQSETVFIIGKLDPSTPVGTLIENTAAVAGAETDPDPSNNEASTSDASITRADLWIDKVQNAATGNPSGSLVFTLTAYNMPGCEADDQLTCWPDSGGPSDAQAVVVTDTLPWTAKEFEVQYVSSGCTYDEGSHTVTCNAGTLAYGQSASFEIQAKVKGSQGAASNTATVSSATPDPDSANNSDEVDMTVKGGTGKTGGKGSGRNNK